jgi:hypothetical protein
MGAHLWFFCVVLCIKYSVATVQDTPVPTLLKHELDKKIELVDGVRVTLPSGNDTRRVLSFEIDTNKKMGEGKCNQ